MHHRCPRLHRPREREDCEAPEEEAGSRGIREDIWVRIYDFHPTTGISRKDAHRSQCREGASPLSLIGGGLGPQGTLPDSIHLLALLPPFGLPSFFLSIRAASFLEGVYVWPASMVIEPLNSHHWEGRLSPRSQW